jgi:mRNA interferase MazF
MARPDRGEIWLVDLDPVRGHEQAGRRPALVVSVDALNHSPAELAIVLPVTSRDKRIRSHVRVEPPEGGLTLTSFVKCEDVRSISTTRFERRLGEVVPATIAAVEDRLRILLGL